MKTIVFLQKTNVFPSNPPSAKTPQKHSKSINSVPSVQAGTSCQLSSLPSMAARSSRIQALDVHGPQGEAARAATILQHITRWCAFPSLCTSTGRRQGACPAIAPAHGGKCVGPLWCGGTKLRMVWACCVVLQASLETESRNASANIAYLKGWHNWDSHQIGGRYRANRKLRKEGNWLSLPR